MPSSFLGLDLGLLTALPLLGTFMGFISGFLALVLVFLALGLILVILIQDPKGGGLASAFGAGPGGDSILGAQAGRDISRITTYMSIALAVVIVSMVLIDNRNSGTSIGSAGANVGDPTGNISSPETETPEVLPLETPPVEPPTETPAPGTSTPGTSTPPVPTPGAPETPSTSTPTPAPAPGGTAPTPAPVPAPTPAPESN